MNNLKKISLLQFRNYTSATFGFDNRVTCIAGANGCGKTNLLDAIYYLCYTKSYFSSNQMNSVQNGLDGFRVSGIFGDVANEESISCKWKTGKKEVFNNNVEYEKVTDHIGRFSAVMIAPDDTELINAGSELRRKWIDSILSQVDKMYLEKLLHYQRVLMQRNAWLKLQATNPQPKLEEIDFYNLELVADAAYIYNARSIFLAEFLPILESFYSKLAGEIEKISVVYNSNLSSRRTMDELLVESLQHDLRLQRTLKGIHRDELEFNLNGISLKQFGSQGQKKSFLFALKLAQYAFLCKTQGHLPILLLDDIFEKLDQKRMEALLRIIGGPDFGQVILTDTHPERVSKAFGSGVEVGFIYL